MITIIDLCKIVKIIIGSIEGGPIVDKTSNLRFVEISKKAIENNLHMISDNTYYGLVSDL